MTRKIVKGDIVTLECVGKLANGMVFTDSDEDGPMKFRVGSYETIRGLNSVVVGMGLGDRRNVTLAPAEAFGEYNEELLVKVDLAQLPESPEKGMQLKSESESGEETIWTVREVDPVEKVAVLDGNHILAGQKLRFEITVVGIDKVPNLEV